MYNIKIHTRKIIPFYVKAKGNNKIRGSVSRKHFMIKATAERHNQGLSV